MVDVSQDPRVEAAARSLSLAYGYEDVEDGWRSYEQLAANALAAADAVGGVPEPSRDADYQQVGWWGLRRRALYDMSPPDDEPYEPVFRRLGDDT